MYAYCDFIADRIRRHLVELKHDSTQPVELQNVGCVESDLTPSGAMITTRKTIFVWDAYGKEYRVTVEEV